MSGVDPVLPADFPQRFSASVANWKRKLLDLSRRNRALNFKPNKVSTIAIVDEQPAEAFRHIYLDEASMRFKASAVSRDEAIGDETNGVVEVEFNGEPVEFESESEQALEYVPYDRDGVDARHRDEWLQTRLAPERLDHALRRIEELARSAIEEQGVNTLFLTLGMLRYRESRDSDTWLRAPLVLLPVELTRKSARSGFSIKAADDDALVNPALVEYMRASYGVTLPELPDAESISDTYDLQTFLRSTTDAVAAQSGWTVLTDMYLGLFSFQKLVMFKDLERNVEPIGVHRLIRQLLSRTGSPIHGLPTAIRELPLDTAFAPESTFQVVDADSSQMRAAAAVVRGHDIVIEGPPGTGKSQTITNLAAQALAAGKTVLFVAEKMAALDVVHRRLVDAGLGEFCLELHSSKANKRAVMKELAVALDASLQPIAGVAAAGRRLPDVRGVLAEYVTAVHEPFGTLGKSPYYLCGELGLVLDAPKAKLNADISHVTADDLAAAERAVRDLEIHAAAVAPLQEHPWRDSGKTLYSEDEIDAVVALARNVQSSVRTLADDANRVASAFGILAPTTLAGIGALAELADVIADSPGVPASVLQSDGWNEPPREANALLEQLRIRARLYSELSRKFKPQTFDVAHAEDVAYVEQKAGGVFGFLAFLDGRFRAIKRRWITYRQQGYAPSLFDQAALLKRVDQVTDLTRQLNTSDTAGRTLFGTLWQGASSDATKLEAYISYVLRYRRLAVTRAVAAETARVAEKPHPDVSPIRALVQSSAALQESLAELRAAVAWSADYLAASMLPDIGRRVGELADKAKRAPVWAAFEGSRQRGARTIAAEVVAAAIAGSLPFQHLTSAFLRAFYMKWMSMAIHAREPLHRFDTLSHEGLVREFRELDQQVLRQNRIGLVGRLRDQAQHKLRQSEAAAALPKLRREMTKQRRLSPLRRSMRECDAAIRAIKPCFMMSPLTVAQFLDGNKPSFDLVIFDEASQLPTEDAIGAIIRGNQLVVVGDPKQLPPTDFFAVSSGTTTAPLGDDGTPLYEDSESVLEEFMGAAVPMSRLKWHYRSAHESLITFSNVNFYDADLHTFPSVVTDVDAAGLQFHFVDGGIYEGKGVNVVEARQIADEVVAFAKLQLDRKAAGDHPLSLGVGTLNLRQQVAILDELEVRRRHDPSIEAFFDRSGHEPFFVKNLENIQGDERDAIFLSITYGKSADGRLRYNFGPLNRENGWRRLNVLVTRARRQMKVFSSIRDHDINPAGATSEGPRLLREFLAYAEHRRLNSSALAAAADAESPFERDVCLELTRRGIRVQPQVGVCGYRVDLGIVDPEVPGRFVCGIECDGVGYHSMETVRDRDRLRQQVLEDRGWIIHRVWSTDWFKDRAGQVDRLLRLIQEARERVKAEETHAQQERVTRTREATMVPAAVAPARDDDERSEYTCPVVAAYEVYAARGVRISSDLLATPVEAVADVVARVVDTEGPVHETDVLARVCDLWGTKAGSRIQAAIRAGASLAVRDKRIHRRGPFFWRPDGRCEVRARTDTGIPAGRIAPEEYCEAVKLILAGGRAFDRPQLIAETRAVMGFNRTGNLLEEAIGNVVDAMVLQGTLGEASGGLMLRTAAAAGGAR
jgi:very-short-patch-repair endonuclease